MSEAKSSRFLTVFCLTFGIFLIFFYSKNADDDNDEYDEYELLCDEDGNDDVFFGVEEEWLELFVFLRLRFSPETEQLTVSAAAEASDAPKIVSEAPLYLWKTRKVNDARWKTVCGPRTVMLAATATGMPPPWWTTCGRRVRFRLIG